MYCHKLGILNAVPVEVASLSAPIRKYRLRVVSAVTLFIALLCTVDDVLGQTSQDSSEAKPSHKVLFERAIREPLNVPELLTPEGDTLTDEQKKKIEEARKRLADAEKLRKEQKYSQAFLMAKDAAEQIKLILGEEHYLSITAQVFSKTMDNYSEAAPEAQAELAKADKEAASAQERFEKGFFAEAEANATKALAERERLLGAKHADCIELYRLIGASRLEMQAYDTANDSLTQAVQLAERAYGRNHPKTAAVLDRHGWMKVNQGRISDAIKLLAEAVNILNRTVGDTPELAESMDNLGTAAVLSGEMQDALRLKLRSLVLREKLLGHKSRDTAVSLSNLAWLYSRVGMPEEVIPLREEALRVFRDSVGPEHTYTKLELTNLCKAYEQHGMADKAIALYREQISRDDSEPALVDISAVQRCTGLGALLLATGHVKEGKSFLDKANKRGTDLLNTSARQPAINELEKIADAYNRSRMLEKALSLYITLHELDEKDGKPNDGSIRRGEDLGTLLLLMDRDQEAVKLLKKVVADGEKVYGSGQRLTATALVGLCDALIKIGQLDEAEKVGDEALRICETKLQDRTLQGRSVATGYTLIRLGRIYSKQKRFDVARFSLEDAADIFKKNPQDPLGLIECQLELVDCNIAAGKREAAEKILQEAAGTAQQSFAKSPNPFTAYALVRALHKQLETGILAGKSKSEVESELKKTLTRMRDEEALDGLTRKWLAELESQ